MESLNQLIHATRAFRSRDILLLVLTFDANILQKIRNIVKNKYKD